MAKKESRATDKRITCEWAKHLRPWGKRRAAKCRRKAGEREIRRQTKDLTG